jgi:Response regulator containing a CheY-like receiver domain and an HTH DNA-binding domain
MWFVPKTGSPIMKQKNILLVDDEPLIRQYLKSLLEDEPFTRKVYEAGDKDSFLKEFGEHIDIILLDFKLPNTNGLELLNLVRKRNTTVKVVAITGLDGTEVILNLLKSGVNGLVYKLDGYDEIRKTVLSVLEGESYYSNKVVSIIQKNAHRWDKLPPVTLTAREKELLKAIANGNTTKEIAETMKMTESTIETYRARLIKKANVLNTAALIAFAYRNGLL